MTSARTSAASVTRNEFANVVRNSNETNEAQKKKDPVMKTKSKVLGVIIAVTQSKWTRPALMTLALLVTLFGVTGCPKHPH